jgi:solute carrier family 13 (sodium-dependent dicarboxylate transporter), member 2/3/5
VTENQKSAMDEKPKILLVDDEDQFRSAMSKRLSVRGYDVMDIDNGEDAIKIVRHENPEVVILDQKMPDMDGIQTLRELKKIRPEVQVIMLTGHGSIESARFTGKHDIFAYMQKPAPIEDMIEKIEGARQEYRYAMARQEIPHIEEPTLKNWLIGVQGRRPGIMIIGLLLFAMMYFMPPTDRLLEMLSAQKGGAQDELIMGYSEYRSLGEGQTPSEHYARTARLQYEEDQVEYVVAQKAKIMIGVLMVAALFWATGAVPIGIAALLVGVLMYWFAVLPPNGVAKAYATDAVFFIFGVLAMSTAISKTGLDRRIGILLLKPSTNMLRLCLIFAPMVAVTASFLSEHAIIAFIAPVFMMVYMGAVKVGNIGKDKALVLMMMLTLNYACNVGGPGSPAAGGRNVIMIGFLRDYGIEVTFGQWVMYGLPFVPVMAIIVGLYWYVWGRNKMVVKDLNVSDAVKRESDKIGKMTTDEYKTAVVLVLLILAWSALSGIFGMGGPVILALVALNILGILRWKDVASIHWEVVFLYAAASAMGYGLAITGAAMWIADMFVDALPAVLTSSGAGLSIAVSTFVGILTNFMSDGAAVASIGPVVIPMATMAGASPVMVGLATSFASSFAHAMVIGTPNNAIIFALAKDYETGEQLITVSDFFKHGVIILLLSLLVMWFFVILGYWRFLPFAMG